eukprot:scaffold108827_cov46-Prasinocladus_malaysianus.AAC.3
MAAARGSSRRLPGRRASERRWSWQPGPWRRCCYSRRSGLSLHKKQTANCEKREEDQRRVKVKKALFTAGRPFCFDINNTKRVESIGKEVGQSLYQTTQSNHGNLQLKTMLGYSIQVPDVDNQDTHWKSGIAIESIHKTAVKPQHVHSKRS